MTPNGAARFVLWDASDLERLLEQLALGCVKSCIVEVSTESAALVTKSDFDRLAAVLEETGVSISLRLDRNDRVRRRTASLLGLPVEEYSAPKVSTSHGSTVDSEMASEVDMGGLSERSLEARSVARPIGEISSCTVGTRRSPTGTIVIAREELVPLRLGEGAGTDGLPLAGGSAGKRPTAPAKGHGSPRSRRVSGLAPWERVVLAAFALLVVSALVSTLVILLVPRARVVLVPETRSLSVVLSYGVLGGGQSLDLALPPREIERRISIDLVAPATGERFEPDGTATGHVDVINPYPWPVVVPSGTVLSGSNGIRYITQEEITVPAADPFGSLSFGSARVSVQAAAPGPDGNAALGEVTGQLENGVFYRNPEAISGGTLRRILLVTEADIVGLRERARADLLALVEQAVHEALEPGEQLLVGTVEVGEPVFEFNHQAGDVAEQVLVHATLTVRARAFDPNLVHQQAREEAGRRLARLAGPHDVLLGNTFVFSTPEPIDSSGLAWRLTASGQARALLSEAQLSRVRQVVLGKSLADAQAAARQLEGVAEARVTLEPEWVPRRLPEFASRIEVTVEHD